MASHVQIVAVGHEFLRPFVDFIRLLTLTATTGENNVRLILINIDSHTLLLMSVKRSNNNNNNNERARRETYRRAWHKVGLAFDTDQTRLLGVLQVVAVRLYSPLSR